MTEVFPGRGVWIVDPQPNGRDLSVGNPLSDQRCDHGCDNHESQEHHGLGHVECIEVKLEKHSGLPSAFSHLKGCYQRQAWACRMLHRSQSDADRQLAHAMTLLPRHEERYVPRFISSVRRSARVNGFTESTPGRGSYWVSFSE